MAVNSREVSIPMRPNVRVDTGDSTSHELGGTLRLVGVTGMVEGVLKLTRIDRSIEIFPTAEAAAQGLPLTPAP